MSSSPHRIAMVLDDTFPPDPRVENECVALLNAGFEVDLFCLTYDNQEEKERYLDIIVYRIPVPRYFRSISALAYSVPLYHYLMYNKMKDYINIFNYAAIHIHDMQIARSVFWLCKGENIKVFLDLHENRPEIMKYYEHVRNWPGRWLINPNLWKKFEKKYIRWADKTIVVTQAALEYYRKKYKVDRKKFIVVPNSIRKSFYENAKMENEIMETYRNKFVISYLGQTGKRRGIIDVLEAVKLLSPEIPNLKFVCIGTSKSNAEYEEYIKNNKLQGQVDILGWKDEELFPSYIEISDICLSPLHRNLHHDTTFANKLFQYMSMGKPIIVSDCDAQAELVDKWKCGLVFKAEDPSELAKKIYLLYDKPEIKKKMGRNSLKAIKQHYNWETLSRPFVKAYTEEINSKR